MKASVLLTSPILSHILPASFTGSFKMPSIPGTLAFFTRTLTTFVEIGVQQVKRMATRAFSLPCLSCSSAYPTKDIRFIRHKFHMHRIHAMANSTEMVNGQPTFNFRLQQGIGIPMSTNLLYSNTEESISSLSTAYPKPTGTKSRASCWCWTFFVHLSPEPFLNKLLIHVHSLSSLQMGCQLGIEG